MVTTEKPDGVKASIDSNTPEAEVKASTTSFLDDTPTAVITTADTLEITSLGPPKLDANDIKDFLAKPVILDDFIWLSSAGANSILYTVNIAQQLTVNQMFLRKLQGYNLIKGTAVIRVTINAQPFQIGRLILTYRPTVSERRGMCFEEDDQRNRFLSLATQQPNVELDCRDGVVEMEVPYTAPTSHMDLNSLNFSWGYVYLKVLSALRPGSGANSVDGSVFLYFKDIELAAPSYVAHASYDPSVAFARIADKRTQVRRGKASIQHVQSSEQVNSLSGGLSTFANMSDYLTAVPVLGPLMTSASFTARALSSVARHFGYSKPINVREVEYYKNHPFRHMHNTNGSNNSDVLALNADSKLEPISGFAGSNIDEMAFNYLKRIPSFVDSFTINDLDPADGVLYTKFIDTLNLRESVTIGSSTYHSYPPAFALANTCIYWRGSVDVIFKIIKSDYHSGRILITFTPDDSFAGPSNLNSSYSIRTIVDIRDTSEVKINLPYLRNSSYLRRIIRPYSTVASGTLEVRVLNQLVTTSVASSTIDVLVYYAGGPDFEIAMPISSVNQTLYIPESGRVNSDHNLSCIGDPVTSVKQLINRMDLAMGTAGASTDVAIYPFIQTAPKELLAGTLDMDRTGRFYTLTLAYYMSGFAFARGGMRVMVPTTSNAAVANISVDNFTPNKTMIDASVYSYEKGVVRPTSLFPAGTDYLPGPRVFSGANKVVDVTVPGSAATPYRINTTTVSTSPGRLKTLDQPFAYAQIFGLNATDPVYVSGADDLQLGFFIGFLPTLDFF